ncbi:hypothetical protein B0T25DRAFT_528315 [Lasiosphaeria hispida]|uniref:Uncharacterized protein n=1 Tax=Lasiosphaeria hispida TaxID=260671 RepID=A0AAJ0MKD7_9PEZI|nr:hypothetical protein B0T25DRAFT_528315 [Lasiosphaeria hispida]
MKDDLVKRIGRIAEYWSGLKDKGPALFFTPLLTDEDDPADLTSIMNEKDFAQVAKENPGGLFREMKIRAIMMLAYRGQAAELYGEALKLSSPMEAIDDWTNKFGSELSNTTATHDELTDALAEVSNSKGQILELMEVIANMTIKALSADKRKDRNAEVDLTDTGGPADNADDIAPRQVNPASITGATSSSSQRGSKQADAPIFYNDKVKDTVTFEYWLRQIENKLRVNADHFLNDDAKRYQ